MKVLYLRPEGSNVPKLEGVEVINISLFSPRCLQYDDSWRDAEGIAFTSINAVRCFRHFPELRDKKVFAVGPTTARELEKQGIRAIYPKKYTTVNLAYLMAETGLHKLASFRSTEASEKMREILQNFNYIEIYNYTLELNESSLIEARSILKECKVDAVVLTSSSIARAIANFLRDCHTIITIGPMTSASLSSLRPDLEFVESEESDIEGTVKVIVKLRRGE
ncbi:MAG: uroporphyrinogen-III synthase [Metallosphaera yellowstonensis]|jgi:uroporphyrinogen-III synthase|uniref:Uroporphyrinogen-III synthase n=1 Tax=Metallosphaera yellowstonensis MK1 TaxID=671065 RepID=H2C690_9CREN|nr:uroporphyrinogen-III synthase [Metallosphaera yellowstonensis]EHP69317.1 uroporphyrinogen-III synthase [Metallosphaera yellowstonensis MK1]